MSYEDELQRKLQVLKEQLEKGKLSFAEHLADDVRTSLGAIRYSSDGSIDLSTVDARARSLASTVTYFSDRNDIKNEISLREIQQLYFQYIDNNFGWIYAEMLKHGADASDFSYYISQQPQLVQDITKNLPDFINDLEVFWGATLEPAYYHLQDLPNAKGVYGGDLFPSYRQNIASTCGVFLDTIVLMDPFYHSKEILEKESDEERVRYTMKHALNVLQYKELALADVTPPQLL